MNLEYPANIKDEYNRSFRKLRISLTSKCNFGCHYCVSGMKEQNFPKIISGNQSSLTPDEIFLIVKAINEVNPLSIIKLTGGEPLIYYGIYELISKLNSITSINKISITTNGYFINESIEQLINLGIKNINISLDAATPETFYRMTRKNVMNKVTEGIKMSVKRGCNIKVNAVIMKGINDDQILPLLSLAAKLNFEIRFLELMKMGYLFNKNYQLFFSEKEILNVISQHFKINNLPKEKHTTANLWKTNVGQVFGIIANESSPFCGDCDRLRLDSTGNIYGCISSAKGLNILPFINDKVQLHKLLKNALAQKQKLKFTGSPVSMLYLGG